MGKRSFSLVLTVSALLLLSSCGYHLGDCGGPWVGSTISVPYVCGDGTGEITNALVREVASSGAFTYVNGEGCYCLCVTVHNQCEENIGFRYDRNKEGQLTRTVIPIEGRSRVVAEFSLMDTASGCVVLGPERVSAAVEYDHEFESGGQQLNVDSLGQVTDLEGARVVVPERVGAVLAQRIVDYLRGVW